MNRLTTLSTQLDPSQVLLSLPPSLPPPTPSIEIAYTKNPDQKTLTHLLTYAPFHLAIPIWVLSPLYCIAKLLTGSMETRLNLLLVLVYQYFFHRQTKALRRFFSLSHHYRFFDGYQLIIEDKAALQPEKSLFPFHPHGMVCYGMNIAAMAHPFFQKAEVVGSRMSFQFPWGGLVMKLYGVEGANPENFAKMMSENRNLLFVPGGFEEATITRYGKDRVFLKHRKGFVKLALEFGYTVHPCYSFGETRLYYTYNNETLGLFLNKFKMPGTMAYTKNGLLPNDDVKLFTVVGRGIKMPCCPNPTAEMVDKYHKIYMERLVELYDRWKGTCGGEEKLEIL